MKKLTMILATVLVTMVGCGKDECEKLADAIKDSQEKACKGKSNECWACDCYNQGKVWLGGTGCTSASSSGGTTSGSNTKCDEADAKKCLDDKTCTDAAGTALKLQCETSKK